MTTLLARHARRFLSVIVLAAACDSSEDDDEASGECVGAKCDDLDDDDQVLDCGPDSAHIELARQIVGDIDGLNRRPDRRGSVESLGDLNRDGRADLAVMPGISYASDNETIVLLMTDDSRCPRSFAGAFIGFEAVPRFTSSGGRRDLVVHYEDGCAMVERELVFDVDFEQYVSKIDRVSDDCGNLPCRGDDGMIELAREQLTGLSPSFYVPEMFDAATEVTELPDINGDGAPERVVRPGRDYGPTTRQLVLYLSGEPDACADDFSGEFAATAIEVAEERSSEGVQDILVIHRSECTGESIRHRWQGDAWVPVETLPLDVDC